MAILFLFLLISFGVVAGLLYTNKGEKAKSIKDLLKKIFGNLKDLFINIKDLTLLLKDLITEDSNDSTDSETSEVKISDEASTNVDSISAINTDKATNVIDENLDKPSFPTNEKVQELKLDSNNNEKPQEDKKFDLGVSKIDIESLSEVDEAISIDSEEKNQG